MALSFEFVLIRVIVYGTGYSLKFLERCDIPILAVEILSGVIFGSILGIIGPEMGGGYEFLLRMAAFGLLVIMFDAGLELDPALIRDNTARFSSSTLSEFITSIAFRYLALSDDSKQISERTVS